MIDLLNETYGFVFEDQLIEQIASASKLHIFKEGSILIDFGDYKKECHY